MAATPENGLEIYDLATGFSVLVFLGGVQGTSIAGGVRGPRKSKPLYKSCEYTFSYKRITKDA